VSSSTKWFPASSPNGVQSIADDSPDEPVLASPGPNAENRSLSRSIACALAVSLLFSSLLFYWYSLDNRQPSMDEAGHILCAFKYTELFSHPHVLKLWWYEKLLTVNNFYPPAVYAFNGLLKLGLGPAHFVDCLSLSIYDFVLTISVFATAMLLTGRRLAAVVAAVVVNLYSELIFLSHTYLLDFQVAAMISLGVLALVWWSKEPDWKRTFVCSIALTLVLATKQVAGAFLAGPGLYYFLSLLIRKPKGWKLQALQLVSMAVIAAILMVPWAVASYGFISEFAETNKKVITSTQGAITVPQALQRGIRYYSFSLPQMMTPLLLSFAALAFCFIGKALHLRLLPVLMTAGGVVMISLLPWQYPHHRYVAGALIVPAIYTGAFFLRLWDFKFKPFPPASRAFACLFLLLGILQYFSLCFFPYPFAKPSFMVALSNVLHAKTSSMGTDEKGKANPVPFQDWGHKWVLEIIGKRDPNLPVWLNVMANHVEYNPHTFTLQGKEMGSAVRPTSSRTWTVLGDTVTYSPESALYYQWYLLKSGYAGLRLLNPESEKANADILKFVKESGKFELIAVKKVPDGSEIMLYRQK